MIQSLEYKGKKYPYRIGYRALKKVKQELNREFDYDPASDEMDYEALEALLYFAMEGEAIKEGKTLDIKREEMEFLLDDCLIDLIQGIQAFSLAAEKAADQTIKKVNPKK